MVTMRAPVSTVVPVGLSAVTGMESETPVVGGSKPLGGSSPSAGLGLGAVGIMAGELGRIERRTQRPVELLAAIGPGEIVRAALAGLGDGNGLAFACRMTRPAGPGVSGIT